MKLSLHYRPNETRHGDLVLRLGLQEWTSDSYYLCLHAMSEGAGKENAAALGTVRRLLEQWREAVADVGSGDSVFLPFDFSDQFTRWLRCRRKQDHVEVGVGWSATEGWRLSPDATEKNVRGLADFNPEGATCHMTFDELVKCIEASLDAAK